MRAPRIATLMILLSSLFMLSIAAADVPMGWRWTLDRPFGDTAVKASSEDAGQWPASKAVDGITAEPEGIWQTERNNPDSAWLELHLDAPAMVRGVRICHQHNDGYYRSIDYSIACRAENEWKTMAEIEGNKTAGWREHRFEPVETDAIRIEITKSEHGFRMGFNEVEIIYAAEPTVGGKARVRMSEPYRCGPVPEMGMFMFDVETPEGARVEFATRTAPDAGGKPGAWSEWSAPITESPSRITSPVGEWLQCRARLFDSQAGRVVVDSVTLGWPECVNRLDIGQLVPQTNTDIGLAAHFRAPMDTRSMLRGEITLPGGARQTLDGGTWNASGQAFRFEPVSLGLNEGLAGLALGGARTAEGYPMLGYEMNLVVGDKPLLERVRGIAEWMIKNPQEAIFVEGYNQRTILALYEITGEQRYLDHVRKWVSWLLEYQKPEGYWPTGYGDVYFADTGSALGLFVNYYKFATPEERERIDTAFQRYVDLLLVRGDSTGKPFVHEDGSLGVGFDADKEGNVEGDLNKPYTISTALTGAEIFGALYYMQGNERYKEIAINACDWLLDTMVESGQIPYIIEDWNPDGKNQEWVWERWPYDTSAYAGEGFLSAWIYIDDPEFRKELGERVKPHIEWVLRTQNPDGSWATKGSGDQLRSHGIVNMLLWYYRDVDPDPRVLSAVQRWYLLVLDEDRSAYLKIPGDGIATSLGGRALVDIIRPGVDCYRWKDAKTE